MFFSIIIPTCNRIDYLDKCLSCLLPESQALGEEKYEIIVSDDGSNGDAKKVIEEKFRYAQWVDGPKRGPAANRNNGASYAKGKWLIFLDDDCLPKQNFVKEYYKAIMDNPEIKAFEGAIIPDNWDLLKKDMAECPINISGDCFWSANVAIKKDFFDYLGGFDETYLIAAQEDQQMKINIEKAGENIKFNKDSVVYHPVRFMSLTKQIKRIPVLSQNYSTFAVKNKDVLNFNSKKDFLKKQFRFHFIRAIRLTTKGKVKGAALAFVWAFYGVALNASNWNKMESLIDHKA